MASKLIYIIPPVIALLTACASVTEPMRVAPDTYEVNSSMAGTYPSWSEVKNLALKRANEHCESQGKLISVEKEDFSGARGWTPIEAHIKYKCVDQK